jgi:hypothetical protein
MCSLCFNNQHVILSYTWHILSWLLIVMASSSLSLQNLETVASCFFRRFSFSSINFSISCTCRLYSMSYWACQAFKMLFSWLRKMRSSFSHFRGLDSMLWSSKEISNKLSLCSFPLLAAIWLLSVNSRSAMDVLGDALTLILNAHSPPSTIKKLSSINSSSLSRSDSSKLIYLVETPLCLETEASSSWMHCWAINFLIIESVKKYKERTLKAL